jgi:hypothetical protein
MNALSQSVRGPSPFSRSTSTCIINTGNFSIDRTAMNPTSNNDFPKPNYDFLGLFLSEVLQSVKELTSTVSSLSADGNNKQQSGVSVTEETFGAVSATCQSMEEQHAITSGDTQSQNNPETGSQSSLRSKRECEEERVSADLDTIERIETEVMNTHKVLLTEFRSLTTTREKEHQEVIEGTLNDVHHFDRKQKSIEERQNECEGALCSL